ncbi:hypothetical protein FRC10_007970 [Ceratobasidium sp. 414]|nr:hypothetical protein FRC10_007970 [Ceratobasidium sp. 414]
MIPLRAESSTVSLPPRDRVLTKRPAKAIKLGLSHSVASKSPAKGTRKRAKAPPPPPALAATRKRRAGADAAYFNRPDGYHHIKRVIRRVSPGPAPPVPYLPGEEDIPHSDTESDNSNATILELARPPGLDGLCTDFGVAAETEDTPTEPDSDLVDYDAEGEDEDEDEDGDVHMQDFPLVDCYVDPGRAGVPGPTAQIGIGSPTQPANLSANTSQNDIQAVFGSLDNLRFSDGHCTDGDCFPSLADAYSHPPFAMHQLDAAVDDLQAHPPSVASTSACVPPPPTDDPPHPRPPSRVATPAPWIVVPEIQVPVPYQPMTPLPQSQPTRYTLASQIQTGAPTGLSFPLRAPTSSRRRPRLSTRELVSQARSQAWSPHLPIPPPPANLPNTDNIRTRSSLDHDDTLPLGLTPLRLSLNPDDAGNNTDDAI